MRGCLRNEGKTLFLFHLTLELTRLKEHLRLRWFEHERRADVGYTMQRILKKELPGRRKRGTAQRRFMGVGTCRGWCEKDTANRKRWRQWSGKLGLYIYTPYTETKHTKQVLYTMALKKCFLSAMNVKELFLVNDIIAEISSNKNTEKMSWCMLSHPGK